MRRLQRKTTDLVVMNDHERRINQLERRIMPGPADWAFVEMALTPQPISSGGTLITWETFRTSNPTVFSTSSFGGARNNEPGDQAIRVDAAGMFMATSWVRWENGVFWRGIHQNSGGSDMDMISNTPDIHSPAGVATTSTDGDGFGGSNWAMNDEQWYVNMKGTPGDDVDPGWFVTQANVGAAQPDQDVTWASLSVIMFPILETRSWDNTLIYG